MGHALRACFLGMELARTLRLSSPEQAELYYSFLLMHSGCTVLSLGLAQVIQGDELAAIADATLLDDSNPLAMLAWLGRHVAPDAPLWVRILHLVDALRQSDQGPEQLRGACEVASLVAQRLGLPPGVQRTVRYYQERWDGKGPFGLRGSAIPLSARLLQAALKIEVFTTVRGRAAAEAWVQVQKGKSFDPQVVDAFGRAAQQPGLWETLATEDPWEVVLDREPDSPHRYLAETRLDDVTLAVADFVDLKSPRTTGHARATARIAEGMARRMGLPPAEVVKIRRAALVHDLGLVALPGHILRRQGPLSAGDLERLRLHPYYTERMLARVPALAEVAALAGQHHERLNGTGYYRGLSGSELSKAACILALADEFQERMQVDTGRPAPDAKAVLQALQPEVGPLFAPDCFAALAQEYDLAVARPPHRREWPAGLTEREVEVLRLLATGASNRQIAQALVITEKTAAHHLEHIYNKIGISSRAAAVFFAMEHELIP
jgi:HD-GYP domain-containing protein (c-di-GMP phosphodiesterase class II)/DNA-binding CsgD family transcriptional regulator